MALRLPRVDKAVLLGPAAPARAAALSERYIRRILRREPGSEDR